MPLIRVRPAAPLDRYVACLWWSARDEPLDACERMLPSGGVQLVIALHERRLTWRAPDGDEFVPWSGSIVHGPQASYYLAGPKPTGAAMGVAFRPGAAGAVLGVPGGEFTDRHVPLEAVWGSRAVDLCERLQSAATLPEKFRLIEDALVSRIHRPLLLHPAVARALQAAHGRGDARIAILQRDSGYSARHFIELFRSAVGLAPKQFQRVRRFNDALKRLAAGDARLSEVAAAAGYSDQAHLSREFREFAGVTPARYRPDASDRPLHLRSEP